MKRKILFTLFAVCLLFSAVIVPSFAWEITTNPPSVTTDEHKLRARYYETNEGTAYYDLYQGGTMQNRFQLTNSLTQNEIMLFVYNTEANGGPYRYGFRYTPSQLKDGQSVECTQENYDGTLPIQMNLRFEQEEDGAWFVYVSLFTIGQHIDYFHVILTIRPSSAILQSTYFPYLQEAEENIDTLQTQVDALSSRLNGLEGNNVLDGTFSGLGNAVTSFVTPFLDLGVGGVTLGSVLGVLLIIGALAVFVLLINKIRGA